MAVPTKTLDSIDGQKSKAKWPLNFSLDANEGKGFELVHAPATPSSPRGSPSEAHMMAERANAFPRHEMSFSDSFPADTYELSKEVGNSNDIKGDANTTSSIGRGNRNRVDGNGNNLYSDAGHPNIMIVAIIAIAILAYQALNR